MKMALVMSDELEQKLLELSSHVFSLAEKPNLTFPRDNYNGKMTQLPSYGEEKKIKSAFEPSDPSDRSLSRFL